MYSFVTGLKKKKIFFFYQFVSCAYNFFIQWARELGCLSNPVVHIPLQSTQHFYIVTKPFKGDKHCLQIILYLIGNKTSFISFKLFMYKESCNSSDFSNLNYFQLEGLTIATPY